MYIYVVDEFLLQNVDLLNLYFSTDIVEVSDGSNINTTGIIFDNINIIDNGRSGGINSNGFYGSNLYQINNFSGYLKWNDINMNQSQLCHSEFGVI